MSKRGRHVALAVSVGMALSAVALLFTLGQPRTTVVVAHGSGLDEGSLRVIKSLPYGQWKPLEPEAREKSGVTLHNSAEAFPGVNLYLTEADRHATFIDMAGRRVHRLTDQRRFGPDDPREKKRHSTWAWKLVEPYKNEGFLIVIEDTALFMIDWASRVLWERYRRFHHDVAVADNGEIYALANRVRYAPELIADEPIMDNEILVLSPKGRVKRSYSIASMIAKDPKLVRLAQNLTARDYDYGGTALDLVHANALDLIKEDLCSGPNCIFRQGYILTALRNLNLLVAIDLSTERIVWHWGNGSLDRPHHPTLLENKNILLFDNGTFRNYSRVVEFDPVTSAIAWQYPERPTKAFFSASRGSVQRLPNKNTLIVASEAARVIEVTPAGKVVWEFYSDRFDENEKRRALIYRMWRMTSPDQLKILRSFAEAP